MDDYPLTTVPELIKPYGFLVKRNNYCTNAELKILICFCHVCYSGRARPVQQGIIVIQRYKMTLSVHMECRIQSPALPVITAPMARNMQQNLDAPMAHTGKK